MAPGTFTYASHAVMFVELTLGMAHRAEPFVNPKFSNTFKLASPASQAKNSAHIALRGSNIVDGFKKGGYLSIGTGADR
jgi:hypothetical protein